MECECGLEESKVVRATSVTSDSRDASVAREATLIGAFSWGESDDDGYIWGGSFFENV